MNRLVISSFLLDFETGEWAFDTVKPGRTRARSVGQQAPHINLWVVARGINVGLNTRIYFEDEVELDEVDKQHISNILKKLAEDNKIIDEKLKKRKHLENFEEKPFENMSLPKIPEYKSFGET